MRIKKFILSIIIGISLVTPLIYSFTFFNGFAGQIKPTDYPPDWYEVNNFLNNDSQDFKVLFLPWHQYMDFSWIKNRDKRIANPAGGFFDKEVISGTNMEIGGIYREDSAPEQLYIDSLIRERDTRNNITNFGELVSIINVKYIILAKEVDYRKYMFLFKQDDLELVKDTKTLYVFKNKRNVMKIYQTDDINDIWSDKIEVDYDKISPVMYKLRLKGDSKKYVVFTEPYSEDWKFNGKKSIMAYGVVNAYLIGDEKEGEIIFERFYKINLPAYIISLVTFVVLIILYIKQDSDKTKM